MALCFFASDLHGRRRRYEALFEAVERDAPAAVFLGGDLLPHPAVEDGQAFLEGVLARGFGRAREALGDRSPRVFLILGNDDPAREEEHLLRLGEAGLWDYAHGRRVPFGDLVVCGYSFVPPSPFLLKDWERYDVSRYVDPGCVAPEDGIRTLPAPEGVPRTIQDDLAELFAEVEPRRAIFLFHGPPYRTLLDRAALDGRTVDHAPLDVHVGSIAVRRFIEERQPLLALHGHIHESARLMGGFRDRIGRTVLLSAAHDGPELALVRFDPQDPAAATRELV